MAPKAAVPPAWLHRAVVLPAGTKIRYPISASNATSTANEPSCVTLDPDAAVVLVLGGTIERERKPPSGAGSADKSKEKGKDSGKDKGQTRSSLVVRGPLLYRVSRAVERMDSKSAEAFSEALWRQYGRGLSADSRQTFLESAFFPVAEMGFIEAILPHDAAANRTAMTPSAEASATAGSQAVGANGSINSQEWAFAEVLMLMNVNGPATGLEAVAEAGAPASWRHAVSAASAVEWAVGGPAAERAWRVARGTEEKPARCIVLLDAPLDTSKGSNVSPTFVVLQWRSSDVLTLANYEAGSGQGGRSFAGFTSTFINSCAQAEPDEVARILAARSAADTNGAQVALALERTQVKISKWYETVEFQQLCEEELERRNRGRLDKIKWRRDAMGKYTALEQGLYCHICSKSPLIGVRRCDKCLNFLFCPDCALRNVTVTADYERVEDGVDIIKEYQRPWSKRANSDDHRWGPKFVCFVCRDRCGCTACVSKRLGASDITSAAQKKRSLQESDSEEDVAIINAQSSSERQHARSGERITKCQFPSESVRWLGKSELRTKGDVRGGSCWKACLVVLEDGTVVEVRVGHFVMLRTGSDLDDESSGVFMVTQLYEDSRRRKALMRCRQMISRDAVLRSDTLPPFIHDRELFMDIADSIEEFGAVTGVSLVQAFVDPLVSRALIDDFLASKSRASNPRAKRVSYEDSIRDAPRYWFRFAVHTGIVLVDFILPSTASDRATFDPDLTPYSVPRNSFDATRVAESSALSVFGRGSKWLRHVCDRLFEKASRTRLEQAQISGYEEIEEDGTHTNLLPCRVYDTPRTIIESPAESAIANAAPFVLRVHPSVMLTMEYHAHLSNYEIIGLLGGQWDAESRTLKVHAAFPAEGECADGEHVELDPASDIAIRRQCEERGFSIVGWYHSHPIFVPNPSERDIENQSRFQALMRDSNTASEPWIGAIIAPFDQLLPTARSVVNWFHCHRETQHECMSGGGLGAHKGLVPYSMFNTVTGKLLLPLAEERMAQLAACAAKRREIERLSRGVLRAVAYNNAWKASNNSAASDIPATLGEKFAVNLVTRLLVLGASDDRLVWQCACELLLAAGCVVGDDRKGVIFEWARAGASQFRSVMN